MINCFCPSCGVKLEIQFFVPSKLKTLCAGCRKSLLIAAKDNEIIVKYQILKLGKKEEIIQLKIAILNE